MRCRNGDYHEPWNLPDPNNEELVEMNEQQYDSEKLLQSWLARYPAQLVGNQIDAKGPRHWLFIEQVRGAGGGEIVLTESGSTWDNRPPEHETGSMQSNDSS